MQIVANEEAASPLSYKLLLKSDTEQACAWLINTSCGRELEVDAICDGNDVFVPGIMEHVERTGVHSGDSISIYPTFTVSQKG